MQRGTSIVSSQPLKWVQSCIFTQAPALSETSPISGSVRVIDVHRHQSICHPFPYAKTVPFEILRIFTFYTSKSSLKVNLCCRWQLVDVPKYFTSWVTSSYVTLIRAEMGHLTCKLSLFNCNKNTIRTKRALIMKNPKTDEFLKSFKSLAIRACEVKELINIECKARFRSTCLFSLVLVDGEQILVDQVLPELHLGARQKVDFALFQLGVFDPVRVGQEIAFVTRCGRCLRL